MGAGLCGAQGLHTLEARPIARGGQAPTIEPTFQVPPGPVPRSMPISHMLPVIPRFMYAREFQPQVDPEAPGEPSSPSPSRSDGEQSASEDASAEPTLDEDSYSSSEEDSPHKAPPSRHPKAPWTPLRQSSQMALSH